VQSAAGEGVPVRTPGNLSPVREIIPPDGERVSDMGQNMGGSLKFSLRD